MSGSCAGSWNAGVASQIYLSNSWVFFAKEAGGILEWGGMFVQNSDCYIRLNFASPKAILKEGLERICNAVAIKNR